VYACGFDAVKQSFVLAGFKPKVKAFYAHCYKMQLRENDWCWAL
jgi:hypothetical protein